MVDIVGSTSGGCSNTPEIIIMPHNNVLLHEEIVNEYLRVSKELDTQISHSNPMTLWVARQIIRTGKQETIGSYIEKISDKATALMQKL